MKIDDIHAFVSFVELQSTSLAAEQLGISQPAITRRIQSLEASLGLQLFDRNTRPLKLTQAGFQIYEQCARITSEIDRLDYLVNSYHLIAKKLKIGVATSLSDSLLAGILEQLKLHYPALNLEIVTDWGVGLIEKFKQQQLDCLILTTTQGLVHAQIESLGRLNIVPVVAKKLNKVSISHLADCQSLGWILNTDGCGFRQYLVSEYQKLNQHPNIKVEVTGANLQMNLLAQGLGVGLLPKQVIENSSYAAQLSTLHLKDFELEVNLYSVIQSDLNQTYQVICHEISRRIQGLLS